MSIPTWAKDMSLEDLFDNLFTDFELLQDGSWVPDDDSIAASVDVLTEIKRRVVNRST